MDRGSYHRIWSMVKVGSDILSLCFRTTGLLERDWQNSGGEGDIFVRAGVDRELSHLCREQRATCHYWWQHSWSSRAFCWGASDSAKPQLALKVAASSNGEGFGSIYTSGQLTGSPQIWRFCPHSSKCFLIVIEAAGRHSQPESRSGGWMSSHPSLFVHETVVFTFSQNELRAQGWGEKCRKKRRDWSMISKEKYIRKSVDREVVFPQTSSDEQL